MGVCFRQTSIVWVVFVAGTEIIKSIESASALKQCKSEIIKIFGYSHLLMLFLLAGSYSFFTDEGFKRYSVQHFLAIIHYLASHAHHFLLLLWPHLLVIILFLCFVWANGGIVLGDRKNHTPCLHLPQVLYFFLFSLSLSPSLLLDLGTLRGLVGVVTRKPRHTAGVVVLMWLVMGVAVYFFT